MRLNVNQMIHTPGAELPFSFSMDLRQEEFFGEYPVSRPVQVSGTVKNRAGVLVLEGEAVSTLELSCDRCMEAFRREKHVPFSFLLAEEREDEENEEIVLLENGEVDVFDLASSAFILDMDTKHLCAEDCRGLCQGCGANLNREPCRCKKQADPRWAALEQLLHKDE